MAVRLGRSPSQLLLPLAFAAHAGSLLALTGTPVNVIVSEAAARRRRRAASASSSSRSSACRCVVGTIAIVVLSASGCCPSAAPRALLARLQRARAHADRAVRARRTPRRRCCTRALRRRRGRDPAALGADRRDACSRAWSPRAATSSCSPCSARARTLGPARRARRGDTLLLQGTWEALDEQPRRPGRARRRRAGARPAPGRAARPGREAGARRARRRWSCCSRPAPCRRPSPGLLAAGAIVLLRRADASSRPTAAISWTTVILVGGMIPLSTAMIETRRGRDSSPTASCDVVGDAGPARAAARPVRADRACSGQLISNMATALIVIPIAVSAAADMDVSAEAGADGGDRGRGGVVPHAGRDAGEPDGDGARAATASATTGSSACRCSCSSASSPSSSCRCSGRSERGTPRSSRRTSRPGTLPAARAGARRSSREAHERFRANDGRRRLARSTRRSRAAPRGPLRHLRRRRPTARVVRGRRRRGRVLDHERLEAVRVRAGLRGARARARRGERLGVNATGLPFNSLEAVEQSADGRTNPMVNPGAIATTSLVPGDDRRGAGGGSSTTASRASPAASSRSTTRSTRSASATNHRNQGIARLLAELRPALLRPGRGDRPLHAAVLRSTSPRTTSP